MYTLVSMVSLSLCRTSSLRPSHDAQMKVKSAWRERCVRLDPASVLKRSGIAASSAVMSIHLVDMYPRSK